MWKTVTCDLGKELGLDPPNSEATVRLVPLEWLPNRVQLDLIRDISEAEAKAKAAADREDYTTSASVNLQMMAQVLPLIIKSWTLVDPGTGEPIPVNSQALSELPTSILTAIFSKAIGTGEARDESGIPLANATQSEPSFLVQTQASYNVSGLSHS